MDITPLISPNKKVIISYGDGKINVSNQEFKENLLIYDEQIFPWIVDIDNINFESFSNFFKNIEKLPEIFLIGIGYTHKNLPIQLKNEFKKLSINVEMMITGAACRTFNVLVAEGRDVALAVILI